MSDEATADDDHAQVSAAPASELIQHEALSAEETTELQQHDLEPTAAEPPKEPSLEAAAATEATEAKDEHTESQPLTEQPAHPVSAPTEHVELPKQEAGKPATSSKSTPTSTNRKTKIPSTSSSTAANIKAKAGSNSPQEWNSYLTKQEDTSLALKRGYAEQAQAVPHIKSSSTISSPTKEEREKRKAWAEAANKRQLEAAKRTLEAEKAAKVAHETRMEARRAAVRARIETEKEARLAAKKKEAERLSQLQAEQNASNESANVATDGSNGVEAVKHTMRKRASSPRPLYVRLAEDYERRQAADEEEARRKLEQQSAMKQVRVQALMNGEVVIRPIIEEVKTHKEEAARWLPSYRRSESPKSTKGRMSARSSIDGDPHARDASPTRVHSGHNGVVLYSMHESDAATPCAQPGALGAGTGRRGAHLVTRRPQGNVPGASGRFNSNSYRRPPMVDRACSPFILDPASATPLNAPKQEQFWSKTQDLNAGRSSKSNISSVPAAGALTQVPPPPPSPRRLPSKMSSSKSDKEHHQHQTNAVTAEEPASAMVEVSGPSDEPTGLTDLGDVQLGDSFAEDGAHAAGLVESPAVHEDQAPPNQDVQSSELAEPKPDEGSMPQNDITAGSTGLGDDQAVDVNAEGVEKNEDEATTASEEPVQEDVAETEVQNTLEEQAAPDAAEDQKQQAPEDTPALVTEQPEA